MKVNNFVSKLKDIATNYKTLYVYGCFGAPLNESNKRRYTTNNKYNSQTSRKKMINSASNDTFGFDCSGLIKGVIWGWSGNLTDKYGGSDYGSNGLGDINADTLITSKYSSNISTDFSKIEVGEVVWMKGHIGVYIGNGKVVESTPAWKNKVQITNLTDRTWRKHGKLKVIDYSNSCEDSNKDNFFGNLGYFKRGDTHKNIGKIAEFMYKTFPLYTSKKALGNYYGPYIESSIREFQKRTGLERDGCIGVITLAELRKYGFKG